MNDVLIKTDEYEIIKRHIAFASIPKTVCIAFVALCPYCMNKRNTIGGCPGCGAVDFATLVGSDVVRDEVYYLDAS
jgi:hypothetical protein